MAGISDQALAFGKYNNYRYNGKEEQHKEFADGSGLEWYDFEARMYDNQIGRWLKTDNKAELYQNITPYAYAADQPTNAIDPDGNLIIFINGMYADGSGGTARYWRSVSISSTSNNTVATLHEFDRAIMNHFNDCHIMVPSIRTDNLVI